MKSIPENGEGPALRTTGPSDKTINNSQYIARKPARKATPEELHRALCHALFYAKLRPWPSQAPEPRLSSPLRPIDWRIA